MGPSRGAEEEGEEEEEDETGEGGGRGALRALVSASTTSDTITGSCSSWDVPIDADWGYTPDRGDAVAADEERSRLPLPALAEGEVTTLSETLASIALSLREAELFSMTMGAVKGDFTDWGGLAVPDADAVVARRREARTPPLSPPKHDH